MRIEGLDRFKRKLDQDRLRLEKRLNNEFRRLVKDVFTDLVTLTPQWSGNLTLNWYIMTGSQQASYQESPSKALFWPHAALRENGLEPLFKGYAPTVDEVLGREVPKINNIRWNTKVTLVNPTPYADEVEGSAEPIRRHNWTGNYGKVALLTYINVKYSNPSVIKKYNQ